MICLAEAAQSFFRWNRALGYLSQAVEATAPQDEDNLAQVAFLQAESFQAVGLLRSALDKIEWLLANVRADQAAEMVEDLQARRTTLLTELGGQAHSDKLAPGPDPRGTLRYRSPCADGVAIEGYTVWRLQAKRHDSEHTTRFSFKCCDGPERRGDPYGGWLPKLWHLTALAHVGTNAEGPLQFVEREYTPISTAEQWKQGVCELLIKKYEHGLASMWFHGLQEGAEVYLSRPQVTLMLPSLVTLEAVTATTCSPDCVLYIAGGTGIAPFVGVADHFASRNVALELLYGCRADDVLLLDRLQQLSTGRFHATVALTSEAPNSNPLKVLFPERPGAGDAGWLEVSHGRIDGQLVRKVISKLPQDKLRVVVCGPQAMNDSAFESLQEVGVPAHQITILKA